MRITGWLLLVALSGCSGGESPTRPTPFSNGLIMYEHPRFKGAFIVVTADVPDVDDLEDGCPVGLVNTLSWDHCVSSIRVAPGWTTTIYEHRRYGGASVTITSDVEDLDDLGGPCGDDWDDCISSLRVRRQ